MNVFLDIETVIKTDQVVVTCWIVERPNMSPTQHWVAGSNLPKELRALLVDPDTVLVTHSGYDVRRLRQDGVVIECQLHDTQVMAWLVNENTELSLDYCAQRYLGRTLDKTLQKMAGIAPFADILNYCMSDVQVTQELYYKLVERLKQADLWDYFNVTEAPFTKVLRDMEARGLPVNLANTDSLRQTFQQRMDVLENLLTVGLPSEFNINSPQQVAAYLGQSRFKLSSRVDHAANEAQRTLDALAGVDPSAPWEGQATGTFIVEKEGRLWDHGYWVVKGRGMGLDPLDSVDKQSLMSRYPHQNITAPLHPTTQWVVDYLEYKKLQKLVSTYLSVFPTRSHQVQGVDRLFGRFNQTGTATGRLSSSEPNLQNIPARRKEGQQVRDLFEGNLVVGDFSQLEPRLMAHFSQDPELMGVFQRGEDVYEALAKAAQCTRDVAKTLMLAMSYGAGAGKIAETLTVNGYSVTPSAVQGMLKRLQAQFSVYFNWREKVIAESKRTGHVSTMDGRKRRLHTKEAAVNAWKDPSAAGRQAANAVVQGSAADIVRRVMLHCEKMFPELRLLAQVHDELIWEYDPANPPDLQKLEKWVLQFASRGVSVPLEFTPHIGTSWYRAKEGI